MMTLLNAIFAKHTGIDLNIWVPYLIDKGLQYGPYFGNKTYNVIIITSPYFGYAFYTAVGFTAGLKLAEIGYNYDYFLSKTIEKTPVVSHIAWGLGKLTGSGKEATNIAYYPLFDIVMASLGIDKLFTKVEVIQPNSITTTATNTSILSDPIVQNNLNQQNTLNFSVSTQLPVSLLEPNSEPVTPREFSDDGLYQGSFTQPRIELIEKGTQASFFPEMYPELVRENIKVEKTVEYRDRQNLTSILNKLDRIEPLLIEQNLILQGLQGIQGRNGLLKEIKNLEQFNDPQIIRKYSYKSFSPKLVLKFVRFSYGHILIPNIRLNRNSFRIELLYADFNDPYSNEQINIDFDNFSKEFPFTAKTLEICFRNAEKHKFQLGIAKPQINLAYRQESNGYFGGIRNIMIPEESVLIYTSTGNNFPLMDTVLDLFNAQNDNNIQPEINIVCRSLRKHIGKNLLGIPKVVDVNAVMYDNVVGLLNVHEEASVFIATEKRAISLNPLTRQERKPRMKEVEIQNHIEVDRPNLSISNSTDIATPLLAGSTIVLGTTVSGLAQYPITDIWNFIFHLRESAALLADSHFISVVTQAFPNVQIPVQETVRTLEAAHSIVDNVVINSTVNEGSLPVTNSNVTSSLNGILPNLSWKAIIIGAGAVGLTVYLWKSGLFTQATEVNQHAKDLAEIYGRIATLKK